MSRRKYLLRLVKLQFEKMQKSMLIRIIFDLGYGMEVDCWAVGIILYILLCGYPPFKSPDRNQEALFQLIQRGKFVYDTEYWSSISASKIQRVNDPDRAIVIRCIFRCKKFN